MILSNVPKIAWYSLSSGLAVVVGLAIHEPMRASMRSGLLSHTLLSTYSDHTITGANYALVSNYHMALFISLIVAVVLSQWLRSLWPLLGDGLARREKRRFHREVVRIARERSRARQEAPFEIKHEIIDGYDCQGEHVLHVTLSDGD